MAEHEDLDSMATLASLLTGYAKPVIDSARLAPSFTYDFEYRSLLVLLAFDIHAKSRGGVVQINSARLKLLQFAAQRPLLVPILKEWSRSRKDADMSLLVPQHLRRSYVTDPVFEPLLDYLVAADVFGRTETHVLKSMKFDKYQGEIQTVREQSLFSAEITILEELQSIMITNDMLGAA
jgi:hypothetical protein